MAAVMLRAAVKLKVFALDYPGYRPEPFKLVFKPIISSQGADENPLHVWIVRLVSHQPIILR
jgi:hypothetical protein